MKRNEEIPLRLGVGIVVLNNNNEVFVGKRIDNQEDFWQMPQGGVDKNENFLTFLFDTSFHSRLRDDFVI